MSELPHARGRVAAWADAWRRTGRLILFLDFDGTLAPIVDDPLKAGMPERTRRALEGLRDAPGVEAAIVSGRGLASVRERAGIGGIAYAGNHGMEIDAPGLRHVHAAAERSRPLLATVARRLAVDLRDVTGATVEDKLLTLSIHTRRVAREDVDRVRTAVFRAVAENPGLHVTEGKEVLEIRPTLDWDKGRAVEFLLERLEVPAGAPVLYLGDDRTDEAAFRALLRRGGEGIVVGDPAPPESAACARVRDPAEVGDLLAALLSAIEAPDHPARPGGAPR